MNIGEILVRKNLATREQVDAALERQKLSNAPLGKVLVNMGVLSEEALAGILNAPPEAPKSLAETGISTGELRNLMLKTMSLMELQIPSEIADALKLPTPMVRELLEDCVNQKLVEVLGSAGEGGMLSELRHSLTKDGKIRAGEALEQCLYVGPAPVCLESYHEQIAVQKITNERLSREQVDGAFSDLVISQQFIENIGPAANSGRAILLYGPPGNGKTSIAERVAGIFTNVVYIPYCIQVDGQIIKVFDPALHVRVDPGQRKEAVSIRRDSIDRRWVPCLRPVVVTGGELTLEMLDLSYNAHARFYEAPLHVKALGGTFIIDDFGRQLVRPEELLDRWIVPLQNRIDYLKLHTGKSFEVPFDELVIFSTNMEPNDLMDPAFLRRIPYKLETVGPNEDQFRQIFSRVAESEGLTLSDEVFRFVVEELTVRNDYELACYQPRFIVDQVLSSCKFEGGGFDMRQDLVARALGNLFAKPSKEKPVADVRTQVTAVEQAIASDGDTQDIAAAH
jgi:energy-coupling factor transporter ATP-binding protein EcfA2